MSFLSSLRGSLLATGFSLLTLASVRAQAPVGRWQLHTSGTSATAVAEVGDVIYCATYYGFFRYDRAEGSIQKLSRQDGFSADNVAALAYDSVTHKLVIGYDDTNIDLLDATDNSIINLSDVKRKQITGTKRINSIATAGRKAYLATSFGIVVIDLDRLEVSDTYSNLGRAGEVPNVYGTAVLNDSLYAATEQGVKAGSLRANLLDFRSWWHSTQAAQSVAALGGKVYAADQSSGLLRLAGRTWTYLVGFNEPVLPTSLTTSRNQLVVARRQSFTTVTAQGVVTNYPLAEVGQLWQGRLGRDGRYYLAAPDQGLFTTQPDGTSPTLIAPNGPTGNASFATAPAGADTYAFMGGYDGSFSALNNYQGFGLWHDGSWTNYNARTTPDPAYPAGKDRDLTSAAYNPTNGKVYIGSFGNGLIEWGGPGQWKRFDPTNSPLQSAITDPNYTQVTGVAVDPTGLVWVVNHTRNTNVNGLFSYDPATGNWRGFLANLTTQGAARGEDLVIDDSGYKWMSISTKTGNGSSNLGIIVLDDQTNRARVLDAGATNGAILGNGQVNAMAKDRKGVIWIGTEKGIQVFDNPSQVLPATNAVAARQPIIDRRPLLDNQRVTAIAVDGGNRKWVGTNEGVWLFGEDGDELVANFTTDNSPLPSDHVTSLSINGVTGEVFIGTERGLVAFRGTATEAPTDQAPTCAKVFPNPVPARFQGQIAIDNLTANATVKITDVAGMLVYETKANGGRAVWNARDYQGRRVRTGIYMAYTADADGNNTCVSKIAVVGE